MENPIKKCVLHGAVNNETVDLYPRTNLASVADMTAFSRTLSGAADAAAARKTLEIQTSKDIINIIYPVGSVITLTNDTDPNEIYQGTTWVKMDAGRVLVSAGTYTEDGETYTYTLGDKGGEAKHQNTIEEMPAHGHAASISSTSLYGEYHNSLGTDLSKSSRGIIGIIGTSQYRINGDRDSRWPDGFSVNASHGHTISVNNAGGGSKVNNLQPYEVVNYWKRTA
jgi:microcystin-dependent protein|nr:MAG TPA: baseplate wedge protein [Caudoviricetes sp.]